MPEFWLDSGYRLLDRSVDGVLEVTDDFLRAYLMRPEIEPVAESCEVDGAKLEYNKDAHKQVIREVKDFFVTTFEVSQSQ